MQRSQLDQLLEKYENGNCTQEEQEILFQFFDSFQDHKDIWEGLEETEKQKYKNDIFNAVNAKINQAEHATKSRNAQLWKVAASILLISCLGLLYLFVKQPTKHVEFITKSTEYGQKLKVKLHDGSLVHLNSGSSITYPKHFTNTREIRLAGEAFFEVVRNPEKPFLVKSGEVTTRVLGTSFNISAYRTDPKVQVTVASGKVKVTSAEKSLQLLPGQQASYSINHLILNEVDIDQYLAWREGVLVFDGSNLEEIASELERWYGVDIAFESVQSDDCNLKLSFDNLSLNQVLKQLEILTGISYVFTDNQKVEIRGIGCAN